jgi:hypothetical protein
VSLYAGMMFLHFSMDADRQMDAQHIMHMKFWYTHKSFSDKGMQEVHTSLTVASACLQRSAHIVVVHASWSSSACPAVLFKSGRRESNTSCKIHSRSGHNFVKMYIRNLNTCC